jgi:hypothetical protein
MMRHALAGLSVAALAISLAGCGSSSGPSTAATSDSGTTPSSAPGTATASGTGTTSQSGAPGPTAGLTVAPPAGRPTSVFRFSFRAPATSGHGSTTDSSYMLRVAGGGGVGCVGGHAATLPAVQRGELVGASLGPTQLGGRWCTGTYAARIEELARPVCAPGQMCPQFVRIVAVIGPATFRITQ